MQLNELCFYKRAFAADSLLGKSAFLGGDSESMYPARRNKNTDIIQTMLVGFLSEITVLYTILEHSNVKT